MYMYIHHLYGAGFLKYQRGTVFFPLYDIFGAQKLDFIEVRVDCLACPILHLQDGPKNQL